MHTRMCRSPRPSKHLKPRACKRAQHRARPNPHFNLSAAAQAAQAAQPAQAAQAAQARMFRRSLRQSARAPHGAGNGRWAASRLVLIHFLVLILLLIDQRLLQQAN